MLLGFDNEFIVKNMFGDIDIFKNGIIDNIIYYPLGGRITIEIQIKHKVIKQQKKWGEYDYISLSIDFFGIKESHIEKVFKIFYIKEYVITKEQESFYIIFIQDKKTNICFRFSVARIQKIIPMKYNEQLEYYESAIIN